MAADRLVATGEESGRHLSRTADAFDHVDQRVSVTPAILPTPGGFLPVRKKAACVLLSRLKALGCPHHLVRGRANFVHFGQVLLNITALLSAKHSCKYMYPIT